MVDSPLALPDLVSFDEACRLVVGHLERAVPLAFWSVTRHHHDRQIYLRVIDHAYGSHDGDAQAWSSSLCQHMVAGRAPQIAPDAMAVPAFANPGANPGATATKTVGAYVGIPIRGVDGVLFGTLCGLDPQRQPDTLHEHADLLHLCATLLGQILQAENLRLDAIDREAELRWNSHHDHLTALPNRGMFLTEVHRVITAADATSFPVAVMLIDIDDFKAVNDAVGYATGDDLLVLVASRLRTTLGGGDVLARLSGDEFAVLVAGPPRHRNTPVDAAQRILRAFDEPFLVGGTPITVSASVGVTTVGPDRSAVTVDALLAQADIAMYSAKRAGKARYAVRSPAMTMPGSSSIRLREPLRTALETGGLEAHYQAVIDLRTARPVGFEALARWRHDGHLVAPDVFVPLAAQIGMMASLTDHMLDLACAQAAAWSAALGHHDVCVGVNISPICISDPRLPERVARNLQRHGIRPHQLPLEITEEALLIDLPTVAAVSHELSEIGVPLVLDDFGTGYSSLLHLSRIPLQAMKIDRGFVSAVDTDPHAQRFVHALLNLARDLDLTVVVEGVEREEQARVLQDLGAVYVQGYLYGAPAPPAEIDPATGARRT